MFEADVIARLDADAAIAALIGNRYFPIEAPRDTPLPYAVYHTVDTDPDPTLKGRGLDSVILQIEVYAQKYIESRAIADAMRDALDGWQEDPPAAICNFAFAGAHDGAGEFDETQRVRRAHSRASMFTALVRA